MIASAGASRTSSVFGLNARPSTATVRPRAPPSPRSSFSAMRSSWRAFTSATACSSGASYWRSTASCASARTSFGKHDPP